MSEAPIPTTIAALSEDYVRLWREFSPFPTRVEVFERTRLFKPRTLANMDCQGRGPAGRVSLGGRIRYPREEVVLWFAGLAQKSAGRHPNPHASLY